MTRDDHKKNFARLARDGGYTIAQYAAEFNLNPNTARRYLRAFKEDTRGQRTAASQISQSGSH
ncbi:helix-turn-helix domain-containing protein [Escherichia coli]|nr:helix-turn-helix domain-containing protein [Escherichia coli]